MSLTEFEKQCNDIVPKMLKRFGPTSRIGSSIPDGPGSAGGPFRVFVNLHGFKQFWLGGGASPSAAWKDALKRWRGKKMGKRGDFVKI
jgi:hypothetical protein